MGQEMKDDTRLRREASPYRGVNRDVVGRSVLAESGRAGEVFVESGGHGAKNGRVILPHLRRCRGRRDEFQVPCSKFQVGADGDFQVSSFHISGFS